MPESKRPSARLSMSDEEWAQFKPPAEFEVVRAMVKSMLENPGLYSWSLQGFGMLRTYINPELRLHVWDSSMKVEDVSEVHDHPWNFDSLVVSGQLEQNRFDYDGPVRSRFMRQTIVCGVGGGPVSADPVPVWLSPRETEIYTTGDWYHQEADEIHRSRPVDGTVTVIRRTIPEGKPADLAHVFWQGDKWVSAEPRSARPGEIVDIVNNALRRWDHWGN